MRRRWLFWLLIIAFVWVVVSRFTEIEKLVETLAQGQWQWVLAAALLQVVYYIVFTGLYQSAFYTVEVESRVSELLPVMFASIFVNVAAPTGGASGAALFVDDAVRRGQSAARAAAGTVLVLAADFGAFIPVLIAGLIYLFLQHDLQAYEIAGAAIFLLIIGGLTSVFVLGLWQPDRLRQLLGWLQCNLNRLAGRFRRPPLLAEDWADKNAAEFTGAAAAIATRPRRLGRTLAVALAAHLIDLTSLYTLFLAFHQPVGLGILVAGFAVGILFWIVSITPQGIGVVEGIMALVYTSLDVPAERATVIALAFRGLTFWLPLVIGFFLLRRLKSFGAKERSHTREWRVRVVALLTTLMGVLNILSAITPALASRLALLERFFPLEVRHGGHLSAALAGFALLLLAGNLWRRKRVAWLLTLIVLVISSMSHLLKGLDYEEAALAAALAIWLWLLRSHFYARSDPPSVQQGLRALAAALLFTLAYGTMGFYLLDRHFSVDFDFGAAMEQTVFMFTQFYDPGLEPISRFGRYFADSIYVVGAVTLSYGLLMLLRPVLVRQPATAAERARARAIVEAYGRSSLARFTLLEDKSYYFSPGGSVVAYVAKGRVALALGDPIGPAENVAAAIAGFQSHCAQNDWQPAFYQTLPDYLGSYQAAGLDTLCIGQEGAVDLAAFTLVGGAHKSLRSVVNRLTKLGHRTELHEPPLPDGLLRELRAISDEWLAMMEGGELRFSLGWFDDDYIRSGPVMAVHTLEGAISAFANLVPEYQRNEATIDLMRRRGDTERGTMDFLFVALFQWAKEQGYATFNLGLSALSGVGERADDPAVERALHYIYEHVNQFYSYKGLHDFKAKFDPQWSPRYLIYPGPASLPAVALVLVRAHSGDDFAREHLKDLIEEQRKRPERAKEDEHPATEET
jgi:phosphatidylglycerol lysyltransferase